MTSEELDALSNEQYDKNEALFVETCYRHHMTGAELHAFNCGWDWAIEAVRTALGGKG